MAETRVTPTIPPRIELKRGEIVGLCRRFGAERVDSFGSATTGEFDSFTSDYDFLVTYPEDYDYGPWMGRSQELERELRWTMGHPIDLVEDRQVKEPAFRAAVETSRVRIFDASEGS